MAFSQKEITGIAVLVILIYLFGGSLAAIIGNINVNWNFNEAKDKMVWEAFSRRAGAQAFRESVCVTVAGTNYISPEISAESLASEAQKGITGGGIGQMPQMDCVTTQANCNQYGIDCFSYGGYVFKVMCLETFVINDNLRKASEYCGTLGCGYGQVSGCVCQLRNFADWYVAPESKVDISNVGGVTATSTVYDENIEWHGGNMVCFNHPDLPSQMYTYRYQISLQEEQPTSSPTIPKDEELPAPAGSSPPVSFLQMIYSFIVALINSTIGR